ncbi:MAG: hypothetical protein ACXAD7_12275 [Candidatus Kariarchaeaceae archaeon]
MSAKLNDNEISELVGYLSNIRDFEKRYQKSEASLINGIWGVLLILAGVLDLYTSLIIDYYPNFIIWVSIIAVAYIIQRIISTQPLLYDIGKEIQRLEVSRIEVIITTLMFLGTLPIGYFDNRFIIPYVCMIVGSTHLRIAWKKKEDAQYYAERVSNGIYLYAIAVAIIIIGLLDNDLFILQGLIFGVCFGLWALRLAYISKRELHSLESRLEIEEVLSEDIE